MLEQVRKAGREAEKVGVFGASRPPLEGMFEGVYKDKPWHLARQEAEVLEDAAAVAAARSAER